MLSQSLNLERTLIFLGYDFNNSMASIFSKCFYSTFILVYIYALNFLWV